jgi:hypothetical protein
MRNLTTEEIAKLAGRKGVRRIAVENFLASLSGNRLADGMNAHADAASYGWNYATLGAIEAGLSLAYA